MYRYNLTSLLKPRSTVDHPIPQRRQKARAVPLIGVCQADKRASLPPCYSERERVDEYECHYLCLSGGD